MTDPRLDRLHNRQEDSPEALRESIDTLSQAIAALERRFNESTLRVDGELDGARTMTRRLATEVGLMGEALVRRIEAERPRPFVTQRRRQNMWPIALAITLGSMSAIAALIVFMR